MQDRESGPFSMASRLEKGPLSLCACRALLEKRKAKTKWTQRAWRLPLGCSLAGIRGLHAAPVKSPTIGGSRFQLDYFFDCMGCEVV